MPHKTLCLVKLLEIRMQCPILSYLVGESFYQIIDVTETVSNSSHTVHHLHSNDSRQPDSELLKPD